MINILALSFLIIGDVTAPSRIGAGTVLEESQLRGAPADVQALVGRQLTRTIFPGRTVTLADTKPADLVHRNDIVRIVGVKGPLRVETKGRALGEGAEGKEILVMNLESRRTVTGIIVGPNLVEVPL